MVCVVCFATSTYKYSTRASERLCALFLCCLVPVYRARTHARFFKASAAPENRNPIQHYFHCCLPWRYGTVRSIRAKTQIQNTHIYIYGRRNVGFGDGRMMDETNLLLRRQKNNLLGSTTTTRTTATTPATTFYLLSSTYSIRKKKNVGSCCLPSPPMAGEDQQRNNHQPNRMHHS